MTSENFHPAWFNRMTLKETYNTYKVYEYINLVIYTTPDSNYFNASKLMKLLSDKVRHDGKKSPSKTVTSMMRTKKWHIIKNNHPELFNDIRGTGTQPYKGLYLQWILFSTFIGYALANADINFELGEPIDKSKEGYIYMCQPECCDGSNTFKFGRTWDWKQRVVTYGKEGTELLYLLKVPDMYLAEDKMLMYMGALFPCDKKSGDEYFIIETMDDLSRAYDYFEKLCAKDGVIDVTDEYC